MKKLWLTFTLILVCCAGWFAFNATPVAAAQNPDLEITEFSWNTANEIQPNTAVTFSATIKNTGSADVTEPFVVTFGTVEKVFTQLEYTKGITAGESVTVQSSVWKAVTGDHMVVARINAAFTEVSTQNNAKQANLRVANGKLTADFKGIQAMLAEADITNLIFSDDFDSISTVDVTDSGAVGYKWYVDRPYGAVTLTPNDYTVKDGVMTVCNEIPTYNYGLGTYHPGERVGFTYNMGYMEVRLRIPRPRENTAEEKGVPAIWALPDTKLTNQSLHWVELDWLEYWGITKARPGGYYTVCLHEQYGTPAHTWYKNTNCYHQGLGDGEWHTMGWLWQKGLFITYLDGTEIMRLTYAEDKDPTPKHTIQKGDDTLGVFAQLDKQQLPVIIGGSKDNPMELDYVRIWNGGENDYVPQKIEHLEMLPTDFINAYTEDADGNPIKTVNKDNYVYILTGEEDWCRLSPETQNIINGALEIRGQASFPQLLKKAKETQSQILNHTHNYTTVYEKATLTKNGAKHIRCKICDKVKSTTKIYRPYSFKLSKTTYTYNGKTQVPTVTIKDYAGKIIPTKYYTVKRVTECKNAGTQQLLVTMNGLYSGNKTVTYKINPIKSDTCTFKVATSTYTYNGTVRIPSVIVKNANGTTLTKNTHYTVKRVTGCKDAGTHKLLVTMKGNYGGSKTLTFKINPISISKCTIKASNVTYTGSSKVPTVTVKNANGTTLKSGTHYTVSRVTGCKGIGTHKVKITMKGNYSGSKTVTFKIIPPKTDITGLRITRTTAKITVKQLTSAKASGYQIQHSASSKFTNATTKTTSGYRTTTATITIPSAKRTYHVRVRTFKTVNGVRYYSAWNVYSYKKAV